VFNNAGGKKFCGGGRGEVSDSLPSQAWKVCKAKYSPPAKYCRKEWQYKGPPDAGMVRKADYRKDDKCWNRQILQQPEAAHEISKLIVRPPSGNVSPHLLSL
jgi:hypothetical protein